MVFHFAEVLPEFKNPVITIGSFDGVHHGHKKILKAVRASAKEVNGESILITFDPHPRKIIHPEESLGLLCTPEEKYKLVLDEGIDHIVVVPFSRDFSMLPAEAYVMDFLWKNFAPKKIIIGYDHKFGHDRGGDIHLLRQLLPQVTVEEIAPQLIEDAAVSSSKVRKALGVGNVDVAKEMLERYYTISGNVIQGKQLGRTIGFPTANIAVNNAEILIPHIGVYAVIVDHNEKAYKGMMNIGVNPTVTQEQHIHCEVNLFDFDDNLYGQPVTVYFIARMRDENKFESVDALIHQLHVDKEKANRLLSDYDTTNFLAKNNIFV